MNIGSSEEATRRPNGIAKHRRGGFLDDCLHTIINKTIPIVTFALRFLLTTRGAILLY